MEQFEEVTKNLERGLEKIGLYVQRTDIMTDSPELAGEEHDEERDVDVLDLINSGEAQFALSVTCLIGDLAFDQRNVDPEGFVADQEFKAIVPQEEMDLAAMQESMASWKEELDTDDED